MSHPDPTEAVIRRILLIRGMRVMLDSDLAVLYGVSTGQLNQQVRRNPKHFPPDFMVQLSKEEFEALISQSVISNIGRGGRRKLPLVFTQEGVSMLSSVLRSPQAIRANVAIMRAFVRIRETLALHKDLAAKLTELEGKVSSHDLQIQSIFEAIRRLLTPPETPERRSGFIPPIKQ